MNLLDQNTARHPRVTVVRVVDTQYVRSHGNAPKGTGQWLFRTGGECTVHITHNGTFTAARKAAVKEAQANGIGTLYVCP